MQILKIEGLYKSFGGLTAVRDLSFEVNEGEIIGIIGPNGSGKTTTLNLLTGFLKPNSGKITFRGDDVTGLPRYRLCQRGMGRTFQLVKPFLDFTALQNAMVGRVYGHDAIHNLTTAANQAHELLDRVGLAGKDDVLAKDLTLMQRKRLELARALAAGPQLLLLDELMAGLNPGEAEEACDLIGHIRDSGITIIVVEHIVKAIVGLCDRVLVLNMGDKIAEGLPAEVIHDAQVIEVYLGKSYA